MAVIRSSLGDEALLMEPSSLSIERRHLWVSRVGIRCLPLLPKASKQYRHGNNVLTPVLLDTVPEGHLVVVNDFVPTLRQIKESFVPGMHVLAVPADAVLETKKGQRNAPWVTVNAAKLSVAAIRTMIPAATAAPENADANIAAAEEANVTVADLDF
jgi:hypothetical protein